MVLEGMGDGGAVSTPLLLASGLGADRMGPHSDAPLAHGWRAMCLMVAPGMSFGIQSALVTASHLDWSFLRRCIAKFSQVWWWWGIS